MGSHDPTRETQGHGDGRGAAVAAGTLTAFLLWLV